MEEFKSITEAKEKLISDMIAKNSDHESEILNMNLTYEMAMSQKNEEYECQLENYLITIKEFEQKLLINDQNLKEQQTEFQNQISEQSNIVENIKTELMQKDAQCLKKDLDYAYCINKMKMDYEKKYTKQIAKDILHIKSEYENQLNEKKAMIENIQNNFDSILEKKNIVIQNYSIKNKESLNAIACLKNGVSEQECNIVKLTSQLKNVLIEGMSPEDIGKMISPISKQTNESFQTYQDETYVDEKDEVIKQ